MNKPILIMEGYVAEKEGRFVNSQVLKYDAYNANITKYTSISKERKPNEKSQLDSIRFTFYDSGINVVKEFTKKAENHSLNIEEILEENYE